VDYPPSNSGAVDRRWSPGCPWQPRRGREEL